MDTKQLQNTQSVDELASTLKTLGLAEIPQQPNTYPALNPLDLYRSHIAELLVPIAGVDAGVVFAALQRGNSLDMGDLMLPVPALRIKGKKPDVLAVEFAEQVRVTGGDLLPSMDWMV
jgi:arginyl-tRNA synthetase